MSDTPSTHVHSCTQIINSTSCLCRPDEDEDEVSAGCAKINQFFVPKSSEPVKKRHRYFEERGLQTLTEL